jgi:lipopolysaccharide export system protein LptA
MHAYLPTAMLFSFFATIAYCDDPATLQRKTLPPTVGSLPPSRVEPLPDHVTAMTLTYGSTTIRAGSVEQRHAEGKFIVLLTGQPQIEHSSVAHGSFTVSANTVRFTIPSDAIAKSDSVSLTDLDATGSCAFASDSVRISANQMTIKAPNKTGRSTILFDGDVVFSANGLTASADSLSLTRSGTDWTLSGVLAPPQDGG